MIFGQRCIFFRHPVPQMNKVAPYQHPFFQEYVHTPISLNSDSFNLDLEPTFVQTNSPPTKSLVSINSRFRAVHLQSCIPSRYFPSYRENDHVRLSKLQKLPILSFNCLSLRNCLPYRSSIRYLQCRTSSGLHDSQHSSKYYLYNTFLLGAMNVESLRSFALLLREMLHGKVHMYKRIP